MQLKPMIQSKFTRFKNSFELSSLQDSAAFERFVNHAILSFHQPDAFTADSDFLEKVSVGGQQDTGIDGLAIKVNGILIKNIDDFDEVANRVKEIDVELLFIQSKYKASFNTAEFNKFVTGARDFMAPEQKLPCNEKIREWLNLKDYVFGDAFVGKWGSNPKARLYYAVNGPWRGDKNIEALAEQAREDMDALLTYESPNIQFIDEEALKNICDSNENRFEITLRAYDFMELTSVEGVDNSGIAVCYADEFINLLTIPENQEIRKSLFEDNVRDYQGQNTVNNEIGATIRNDPSKFILVNNGITIVCDDFKTNNKRITIKNPQIVNGCQTSHVLFFCHKQGLDCSKLPLSIKIISTQDIGISNQIVRGTNRQNQVLEEAFETTRPFHQRLEEFFSNFSHGERNKLYYERRSKQYNHNPLISRTHIINLRILIQSFTAMFLNRPHESHKHESRLLREFKGIIFLDHHSFLPYYVASLSFFYLEKMFRDGLLTYEVRAFKPHLLMMFREAAAGELPSINSEKNIDAHCDNVLSKLAGYAEAKDLFLKLAEIFREVRDIWIIEKRRSRDGMKDVSDFTDLLLKLVRKSFSIKATGMGTKGETVFQGTVLRTLLDKNGKWCGFIRRSPDNVFFHSAQHPDLDFNALRERTVEYTLSENWDGRPLAKNVKVVGGTES